MKLLKLKTNKYHNFYFFLQPAFLAFVIWLVLIFVLPVDFNKYRAQIVDAYPVGKEQKRYFHDLQNDGQSELIYAHYNNVDEFACILYYDSQKNLIDQWNFRGYWLYHERLVFGDYDQNDLEEVYCLTQVGDSIFLHAKELMAADGLEFQERFVCKSGTFNIDKTDVAFRGGKMMDIDRDGYNDLVFVLYAGFSLYPRNVYAYYIRQDSLVESPRAASGVCHFITFMDLNDDGIEEITGKITSPENIHDDTPYTDSTSWLMVFDPAEGMDFLFPPKRYNEGMGSYVLPEFFEVHGEKYLAASFINRNSESKPDAFSLKLFNAKGELIKQRRISFEDQIPLHFVNADKKSSDEFYLIDKKGNSYFADTSLKIANKDKPGTDLKYIEYSGPKYIDADGDSINEVLYYGSKLNDVLVIYRYDLSYPVLLEVPERNYQQGWHVSKINDTTRNKPLIGLQAGTFMYHINYGKSPVYLLKYPFYIGLYGIILLFFWLLQKLQNKLAKRRFDTERQLMQQQLAISKKQLEPHFMLNTLNNIGYLFMKEKREKAQYYFGKFASLIHRGLKYADQVETSLEEELKFIRDYLELQKYRMGNDFSYAIELEDEIEPAQIKIPHSLLFTFVENAIKHGLMPLEGEKLLTLRVKNEGGHTLVIIQDNGIGRSKSKDLSTFGTGKGLLINQSIIASYNKLYEREISCRVEDLMGGNGEGAGTVVRVSL